MKGDIVITMKSLTCLLLHRVLFKQEEVEIGKERYPHVHPCPTPPEYTQFTGKQEKNLYFVIRYTYMKQRSNVSVWKGNSFFRARVCPVYLNRASAADSSIEHIVMDYSWAELGNVVVY